MSLGLRKIRRKTSRDARASIKVPGSVIARKFSPALAPLACFTTSKK